MRGEAAPKMWRGRGVAIPCCMKGIIMVNGINPAALHHSLCDVKNPKGQPTH